MPYRNANGPAEQPSPLSVSLIISLENHCKNIFVFCDFPTITYFLFHPGHLETIHLPGLIAVALSPMSACSAGAASPDMINNGSSSFGSSQHWEKSLWQNYISGLPDTGHSSFQMRKFPIYSPQPHKVTLIGALHLLLLLRLYGAMLGSHLIFNTHFSVFASAAGYAETVLSSCPLARKAYVLNMKVFLHLHKNTGIIL